MNEDLLDKIINLADIKNEINYECDLSCNLMNNFHLSFNDVKGHYYRYRFSFQRSTTLISLNYHDYLEHM